MRDLFVSLLFDTFVLLYRSKVNKLLEIEPRGPLNTRSSSFSDTGHKRKPVSIKKLKLLESNANSINLDIIVVVIVLMHQLDYKLDLPVFLGIQIRVDVIDLWKWSC